MTKGYLLDTNIVSFLIRGMNGESSAECQNVLRNYQALGGEAHAFICAATTGEIEYGLNTSPQKGTAAIHNEVRNILDSFSEVLKLDKHVAAEHYAKLRAKIFLHHAPKDKKGRATTRYIEEWLDPTTGKAMGINENDVWIVAVALTHNLKLVTNDKKMGRILALAPAGLSILNWASS